MKKSSEFDKFDEKSTRNKDFLTELTIKKYPDLAPNLRENIQSTVKLVKVLNREFLIAISEIIMPISEIDWSEVNETWIVIAEKIGMNGWTIPLQINLHEMMGIAALENASDMDEAFARYFSVEENYYQMRRDFNLEQIIYRMGKGVRR